MQKLKDLKVSFNYWYHIKLTREDQQFGLALFIYLMFLLFIFIPIKTYQFKDSQYPLLGEVIESETSCHLVEYYEGYDDYDYKDYTVCANYLKVNYENKIYDFVIGSGESNYNQYQVGGYYDFKKPFTLFLPILTDRYYIIENHLLDKTVFILSILLCLLPIILLLNAAYQVEKHK